jgi:UTP--glucose-1-phosphate uridylyltransferase
MADKCEIRKAVIPCAGYGTRFLPMTKASPKQMLPIVDKPIIQYIVEELVASGITEIILITGSDKRAIEDHFDYNFELEEVLKRQGKIDQYNEIRAISDMAKFIYVRQKEPLGNGHAILQAKEIIGDDPFIAVWGDEVVTGKPPIVKQMIDAYQEYRGTIINVFRSDDPNDTLRYGICTGERISDQVTKVSKILEKPGPVIKPPYLASLGGYLLTPAIFNALESVKPGKNGEIWLPDAISELIKTENVYTLEAEDVKFYDCGSKQGYIEANIEMALKHPDLKDRLSKYIINLAKELE